MFNLVSKRDQVSLNESRNLVISEYGLSSDIGQLIFGIIELSEEDILYKSNRTLTNRLYQFLTEVGVKNSFSCYPYLQGSEYKGDWLGKFVWAKTRNQDTPQRDWMTAKGLAMVCEWEWISKTENIMEDFMRLGYIDADLHIFFYTNRLILNEFDIADLCYTRAIEGKTYLLVGIPDGLDGKLNITYFGK